ncbi:hypothetical protein HDU79_000553 [Rhizoclosmatium sp. JEL0117]|nr:hypothetical protein HDU79_000553 [Rhizoclosmatium sp. JEL0117]
MATLPSKASMVPLRSMAPTFSVSNLNAPTTTSTTRNLLIAGIVLAVLVTFSILTASIILLLKVRTRPVSASKSNQVQPTNPTTSSSKVKPPPPPKTETENNNNNHDHNHDHNHIEPHFTAPELIRDMIIGLSDGLTVPFALSAGLSGLGDSRLVVLAGISELVAGAISMGIGGYLSSKSEMDHWTAEEAREWAEVVRVPEVEEQEVVDVFEEFGMGRSELGPLLKRFREDPALWVQFMMRFELGLEKPDASRVWISAGVIGGSYFMGGLVPLIPYMIVPNSRNALIVSISATLVVLFVFGYVKARVLGVPRVIQSAIEMTLLGAGAAGAAFGISKLLPTPI